MPSVTKTGRKPVTTGELKSVRSRTGDGYDLMRDGKITATNLSEQEAIEAMKEEYRK